LQLFIFVKTQPVSKPRKTGIDVLGDLSWGSHFCVFYETKQDLLDVLVPYFRAGLESNELNLWVISNPYLATVEEAVEALEQAVPDTRKHLESGRLEIYTEPDWYLRGNDFNMENLLKALTEKCSAALARGFDGIRASGDLFWLEQKFWNAFYGYEKRLHDLITGQPAIILCSYPLSRFGGAEVLDIVQAHQFAISRRHGIWELFDNPALAQTGGEIRKITELLQVKGDPPPKWQGMSWLAAVLSVTIALLVAHNLIDAPVSLFLCAIMFSARYGGTGPGLLSMLLSILAFAYYFLRPGPPWNLTLEELSRFLIFALSSLFVVLLVAAQTNGARSLRRAYDVLAATIRKLRETNGALRLEIKERARAEALLQKTGLEFQAMVESSPDPIIRYDHEFRPTYINPAAVRAGALLTDALAGKTQEKDETRLRRLIDSVFASGVVQEYEIHLGSGNLPIYYNVRLCPELNRQGTVVNVLCITRDITKRKQAEETLNRSYEEIRQLSNHLQNIREEERSHIAREIHDELGQQLTVLKMDVLGLGKRLNGEDPVIHGKIAGIIGLLDTTVRSVRRISSELRPSMLDNLGLVAAMEWQLREFEKRSGIKTDFIEPSEDLKIPEAVKNGLFRIFQESLTNAGRHANATKIKVGLKQDQGQLILSVEDNGQGFENDKIGSKQTLGILGMKERIQMMGGNFELISAPAKGTAVVAAVPYNVNE
jgi:PAS domain S-box-containing protein